LKYKNIVVKTNEEN